MENSTIFCSIDAAKGSSTVGTVGAAGLIGLYRRRAQLDSDILAASLLQHEIPCESVWLVELLPVVFVAWSDGVLSAKKRAVILEAAIGEGLKNCSAGLALLESWLDDRPREGLRLIWDMYMRDVCKKVTVFDLEVFVKRLNHLMARVAAEEVLGPGGSGRVSAAALEQIGLFKNGLEKFTGSAYGARQCSGKS